MTIKILKSHVPEDFAEQVEAYRQAKLSHRYTLNEPAPTAHHLVMSCIQRVPAADMDEYVADYEIIDDGPAALTADASMRW